METNNERDLQQENIEIQSICKFFYYPAYSSEEEFKHKLKNCTRFLLYKSYSPGRSWRKNQKF